MHLPPYPWSARNGQPYAQVKPSDPLAQMQMEWPVRPGWKGQASGASVGARRGHRERQRANPAYYPCKSVVSRDAGPVIVPFLPPGRGAGRIRRGPKTVPLSRGLSLFRPCDQTARRWGTLMTSPFSTLPTGAPATITLEG